MTVNGFARDLLVQAHETLLFTLRERLGLTGTATSAWRKSGIVTGGSLVLMVTFGSGFVWASALARM